MSEFLDNRAYRIRTLKNIIAHLHKGMAPEKVKSQLQALVRECDATEIAQMEQELMAEGIPVKQIMGMCDLHSQVVSEIITQRPAPMLPPGHPVRTFQNENAAIKNQVHSLQAAMTAMMDADGADAGDKPLRDTVLECRRLLNELMDIDKHYARKENLLFSMLERHGITGPSKVMWGKDDEVRELLAGLHTALMTDGVNRGEWGAVHSTVAEPAFAAIEEMIFKEERILLPISMQVLTEVEWGEIWTQSPQYGWCLVDPEDGYTPPNHAQSLESYPNSDRGHRPGLSLDLVPPAAGRVDPPRSAVMFPTGALTPEQLIAMFSVLPVDLTFVDADDRVRFFSEGQKRIFVRPKAVIGRKVQHCHPPASVGVVDEILDDFRSGRQDVADFWIELRGRFVFIRYFAMRDDNGEYTGTLEVSQDLTRERQLEGERRLLEYDKPAPVIGSTS